jgi:hypothetical protein
MGYVEKVLSDNEHIVYFTHQHIIVLLERVAALLFALAVFLTLGLTVVLAGDNPAGDTTTFGFVVGLIALGSLVMPFYVIVSAWMRGLRRRELVARIGRWVVAGLFILAAALFLMFRTESQPVGIVAIVIALVPLAEIVRIFFDWLNERYIITNRRVMEVRGIINKHVRDSALEKVNDVELDQSVIGRLLGYGTVQIITGSDIGMNLFRRIANPVRFKREMLNAKERLADEPLAVSGPVARAAGASTQQPAGGPSDVSGPTAGAPAEAQGRISDLLIELAELRQKGILSEEEFQAKKKELLARL